LRHLTDELFRPLLFIEGRVIMTYHIALYGKGGVGKTTLAANISASMVGRIHCSTGWMRRKGGLDSASKLWFPSFEYTRSIAQ